MQDLGKQLSDVHNDSIHLSEAITSHSKQSVQYHQLQKKRDELIGRLKEVGVNKEVTDFLFAIANEEATLCSVTADVNQWLVQNNALGQFRVVL
jgi:hypothetical protein